ncbi:uncharacterized protein LOC141855771 [Brevipalpus obovatus]|uniref:uncharacterized protein LOC141855771 n=1 Tax=Brevipalpus obovatus TaxID=246614 RepID=UPI003D9F4E2D
MSSCMMISTNGTSTNGTNHHHRHSGSTATVNGTKTATINGHHHHHHHHHSPGLTSVSSSNNSENVYNMSRYHSGSETMSQMNGHSHHHRSISNGHQVSVMNGNRASSMTNDNNNPKHTMVNVSKNINNNNNNEPRHYTCDNLDIGGRNRTNGNDNSKNLSSSQLEMDTRLVKLHRVGDSPLGFSIRGGWEHGTGIFVSEVHPGSEAQKEGLKAGDQILRVNGLIIEQAIHEEVITLIKSSSRITLKVKSVGMIPIRSNRTEAVSWKLVNESRKNGYSVSGSSHSTDGTTIGMSSVSTSPSTSSTPDSNNTPLPPPCPVHHSPWSGSKSSSTMANSISISSLSNNTRSSSISSSSRSDDSSDKDLSSTYGLTCSDFMEARVFIRIAKGQCLGCSVVKGPTSFPGIFVQTIKDGGIAQESGLEVGDQIIAMNGISFEPGDMEFNDAIARIKMCSQMTLTVRKRSGLSLFQRQHHKQQSSVASNSSSSSSPKQQVKAIVHTQPPPPSVTQVIPGNGVNGDILLYQSSMSSSKQSSSECNSPNFSNHHHHVHHNNHHYNNNNNHNSQRFYTPSEHDYSLSEVESNGNDVLNMTKDSNNRSMVTNMSNINNGMSNTNGISKEIKCDTDVNSQKIYDQVRREEERLAEEKRKLETQQRRLQGELEKLEKERKQLGILRPQDDFHMDCKSLSSSSTVSGSGTQSISSSGSDAQMGFLDQIKKLAERRTNENGLITDTLNKTRNLKKISGRDPKPGLKPQDDENRKRHELLMEEFRAAHSKMFGQTSKLIKTQKIGDNSTEETEKKNLSRNSPIPTNESCFIVQSSKTPPPPPPPSNGRVSNDSPIESQKNLNNGSDVNKNLSNSGQIKVVPPKNGLGTKPIASSPPKLPTTTTSKSGEIVTILRTTSPCKKAPPVPVKKISQLPSHGPLVTISSYEEPKNRFISKDTKQPVNKSIITVTSPSNGKLSHTDSDISRNEGNSSTLITNEPSQSHPENNRNTTDLRPISIKINVK